MIEGENIICIGGGNWDDVWRNRQQIMSRLSMGSKVFYVNPTRNLHRLLKDIKTFKLFAPFVKQLSDNLFIFTPPVYLLRSSKIGWLSKWVKKHRNKIISKELKKHGFMNPILWLARPEELETIGRFKEKLLCYHVVDEYSAHTCLSNSEIKTMEEIVLKKANLIIVSSNTLLENKRKLNPNTYLVKNAADYNLFNRDIKPDQFPVDIACLPKPRICYVGVLNQKIDYDLLLYFSDILSKWSLLLIGPVLYEYLSKEDVRKCKELKKRKNVYFLGAKKLEEIPAYHKAMDIGIMPYRLTLQGENIFPLKMFEYLASGKPVVSTNIPSVREYTHVIDIAETYEKFVSALERAIKEDMPDKVINRKKVASVNTWEKRVEDISSLLSKALEKKSEKHFRDC